MAVSSKSIVVLYFEVEQSGVLLAAVHVLRLFGVSWLLLALRFGLVLKLSAIVRDYPLTMMIGTRVDDATLRICT